MQTMTLLIEHSHAMSISLLVLHSPSPVPELHYLGEPPRRQLIRVWACEPRHEQEGSVGRRVYGRVEPVLAQNDLLARGDLRRGWT